MTETVAFHLVSGLEGMPMGLSGNKREMFPIRTAICRPRRPHHFSFDQQGVGYAIRQSVQFSEAVTATALKDTSAGHGEGHGSARAPTRGHSYHTRVLTSWTDWAVPNTHCQSLFPQSSVYLKWPSSRGRPFLSSDVLISQIKLWNWSQSSGQSSRPKNVNTLSSVPAGESF